MLVQEFLNVIDFVIDFAVKARTGEGSRIAHRPECAFAYPQHIEGLFAINPRLVKVFDPCLLHNQHQGCHLLDRT
jgi:hypothetical protein